MKRNNETMVRVCVVALENAKNISLNCSVGSFLHWHTPYEIDILTCIKAGSHMLVYTTWYCK